MEYSLSETVPELYVTNFNRNFTGVSATAAGVVAAQTGTFDLRLVGQALPLCPTPITKQQASSLSRAAPDGKPFSIWHVRRNPEMRTAIWARDILRRPIKIVFTSAAQRLHSAYPRWLISKMDAVIATTPEAAKFVPHVRAVVPHGVDTQKFSPSLNRAEDWQSLGFGGRFGVATVGRVRPEKGTDLFVQSMLKVLPEMPDMVALVVGKASRKHQTFLAGLKQQVSEAGLSDRLIFVGEMQPEKLPQLMRSITLLVALPRYEGYGMTPLEALSSGTPFVASDTGYFKAFSANQSVGKVVPIEDVSAASEQIVDYISNTENLHLSALAARESAVSNHSIKREADGIANVYNELWNAG